LAKDVLEIITVFSARLYGSWSHKNRFAYNWALREWQRQYKAGEKPSEVSLRCQLNALKREQYPWMFEVTKCAAQEAIIDLGAAFRGFFEKRGAYPRFKKKGQHDSFCAANETGTFRCDGKRIQAAFDRRGSDAGTRAVSRAVEARLVIPQECCSVGRRDQAR